jgi:hypothetical protein
MTLLFFFTIEKYCLRNTCFSIVHYSRKFVDGWYILLNDVFFLVAEVCALFCGWPCDLPRCIGGCLSYACMLILLKVVADVTFKESYVRCFMLWFTYVFCCLLWVLCFNLSVMVWELKDCISDCFICIFCLLWVLWLICQLWMETESLYLWLLILLDWYLYWSSLLNTKVCRELWDVHHTLRSYLHLSYQSCGTLRMTTDMELRCCRSGCRWVDCDSIIQVNLVALFPLPSFSCIYCLPYLVPELAPYK